MLRFVMVYVRAVRVMDNQQGQQASHSGHGEETKPSTAGGHSRPEQIRYLPVPAGPVIPMLSENRFAQAVTVDQQRELTQYVKGLKGRMDREFEERHDDLRRLRTAFEQMGWDVRDLQDEESSDNGLETVGVPPQQVPESSANQPHSTVQHPPVIPNQRKHHPVDPQPQPIVVMLPTMYAPRPIPAVPRQFRPRQQLPPPHQPDVRVSPGPSTFIPPSSSGSGVRSSHPSTPTPIPPGLGNMGPNVTIIPASSSSSPSHDTSRDHNGGIHHRHVNQPLPVHPRQSLGSDVIVVPLSSASTRSSSPARGMGRLAQHPSVTSLRERDTLRRTLSGRSQRSQAPLVVTSPVPTDHTLRGPVLSTPTPRPASQPTIVMRQSPQSQPIIQRVPSPLPTAVTSTSGPEQIHGAEFPILRAPSPAPIPIPISGSDSPVFMPGASGRQMTPPPTIIRQGSPVSMPRRVQTPFQATQPTIVRTSPTRLSKRHRPQLARAQPQPVILPQPTGPMPPPLQPEIILMPARTGSMRNHQSHHINTSVVIPTPAVTAMAYPGTVSRVRTTAQLSTASFIIPQPSPVSSYIDFRTSLQQPVVIRGSPSRRRSFTTPFIPPHRPISSNSSFRSSMQAAERPVVTRRSSSRSSSRHRVQPNTSIPTQPSRLTKRRRPQPTPADPVLPPQPVGRVPPRQPEVVLTPTQTESTRNRQNRRQLRPIDTSVVVPRPVTAMTYPEAINHAQTTARTSTAPFIIQQPSPTSSNSSSSIRRSPSRSSNRRRAQSTTATITRPSRLTKRAPPPSQPPEIVRMPARTESIRQSRRPISTPTPAAVTALTYPETVSHVRTTAQHPQPRPISSNSSFRSSMQAAEHQPVVIRRSPSPPPNRRIAQPNTPVPTQPSRLTKRRRPQPTSADTVLPPPQPEIVVMPTRTESMRSRQNHSQLRPIDTPIGAPTTRAVTALTYPETVSRVRTTAEAPTIVPLHSPTSSKSSFRASMPTTQQPVVIRTSPSHPTFRAPQHPTSRPEIVVLPPRSTHSTDSSPIVVNAPLAADPTHQISAANGALSDSQAGVGPIVMPLDSDAEAPMAFRPPISRRPSFSGRDMISYASRSRAYSSGDDDDDDDSVSCVTPTSFRGRSPHVQMSGTPTSRHSRIYSHHPDSMVWDQQKSRSHSQRGWYRRRRSSGTGSTSPPAPNPLLRRSEGRGPQNRVQSGPITNTFSIRGEIRTRGVQPYGSGAALGEVIARGAVRGGVERPRERNGNMKLRGVGKRPKRKKSSWSGWLAGL